MEGAQQNIGVQRWVATLSVAILVVKLAAYFVTASVAILTDALESIVNVVAGFFGLYSLTLSAKPRDPEHPYGHGKIEFISAAVEGILIAVAGAYIIVQSVRHLLHPVPLQRLDTGILLVAISGAVNFAVGTWCVRIGRKNNSLALLASGQHLRSDTYTTVGILAGLALLYFTGIWWIDSAVALIFACIIFYTGFGIIRTSIAGIMDARDHALLGRMIETLDRNRSKNWVDIHNIRIIKYGSTLHIDCHLTVPWYLNVHEAHSEVDKLGEMVRRDFGNAIELFVHTDGCLPISCPICIKDDCPVRYHPFRKRIKWTVQNMERDQKHEAGTT